MIKKKLSGKKTAKKTAKKRAAKKAKETHPAEVRKDISLMVEAEAEDMAQAVIDVGKKGQLATVKYLFEFASIFPAPTNGEQSTADEDCLAQTLLRRLNLPDEPIIRDEHGEVVLPRPAREESTEVKMASETETAKTETIAEKSDTVC